MKKIVLLIILFSFTLLPVFSMNLEAGAGLSEIRTEKYGALFLDAGYSIDDFSFYLNWRSKDNLYASATYCNNDGIINHQVDIFSRYIISSGGFTGISYMFIVDLSLRGFYLDLGLGAEGALSYSKYTGEPLFILSPQYRIRGGYTGDVFAISLFLENNYIYEREWNAKSSFGTDLEFNITEYDSITLNLSFSLAEVMMDPYSVLYAYRMRAGYRRSI